MEKRFKSLEQRIISTYLEKFPPFVFDGIIPLEEFYNFMKNIYVTLYKEPELLYANINEDDHFRYRFNRAIDKKPKLYSQMQSDIKKMDHFLDFLLNLGVTGQIENDCLVVCSNEVISKKFLQILTQCGLGYNKQNGHHVFSYPNLKLFTGWLWFANQVNGSLLRFSHCMFQSDYPYSRDIFKKLLGNEKSFDLLEKFLIDKGYLRIDNREGTLALDYIKNYSKKIMPVKDSWAERTHGGISIKYYYYVDKPTCISLRLPALKEVLNYFDAMENKLKQFVVHNTKKCDNCRYCVQTDQTGTRDLLYTTVYLNNKKYSLCPLFPGFYYCWSSLDEQLVAGIIEYLSFLNEYSQELMLIMK